MPRPPSDSGPGDRSDGSGGGEDDERQSGFTVAGLTFLSAAAFAIGYTLLR